MESLKHVPEVIVPFSDNKEFVSNYIFPIVLKDSTSEKRDLVRDALHKRGIQTSVHYPAVHRFSIYRKYKTHLPHTDYITDNEITLPMYSKLPHSDISFIAESLAAVL